jgi:D-glycero-beta-D-manno-heptose-7-phosphate kinase
MSIWKAIRPQKKFRVLLIGDNCTDVYQYGTVDRISPEAPVPVFKHSHSETRPGMAANVQLNLESFGIEVISRLGPASIKSRLVDLRSRQHLLRIDEDVDSKPLGFDPTEDLTKYHAIVFSDYNKGWVSYELVEAVRKSYQGPIFIDTKKQDLVRFWDCYVKINETEYNNRWSINNKLIVTLGSRGAVYQELEKTKLEFPVDKVEVVDVCGAGDTFLSAVVAEFLNSNNINEAIKFANRASAISVQHNGVYALTREDIKKIRKRE